MIQLRIIESGKMQPILEWISGSKFNDALKVALRMIYLIWDSNMATLSVPL